jgi:hypothetical protein
MRIRIAIGICLVGLAIFLIAQPVMVADALGKPHDTGPRLINLRASWGGTLLGLGAFVVWCRAAKPYLRTFLGLLGFAMAGIGVARLVGFALDGDPDTRQYIWISAEAAIAIGCALGVRRLRT